jgi:disulfide bond formation protein DsbB
MLRNLRQASTGGAATLGRLETAAASGLGLLTIATAWASELWGGLVPCALCLEQRVPYYWALPLLALVLVSWIRLPRLALTVLIGVAALLFLWGAWLGGYHAGVEWGFWPGPTACAGTGADVSFSDLQNIDAARVVPCDKVQFRFLGLSLAGYNVLISLAIAGLLGWAAAKANAALRA